MVISVIKVILARKTTKKDACWDLKSRYFAPRAEFNYFIFNLKAFVPCIFDILFSAFSVMTRIQNFQVPV